MKILTVFMKLLAWSQLFYQYFHSTVIFLKLFYYCFDLILLRVNSNLFDEKIYIYEYVLSDYTKLYYLNF